MGDDLFSTNLFWEKKKKNLAKSFKELTAFNS